MKHAQRFRRLLSVTLLLGLLVTGIPTISGVQAEEAADPETNWVDTYTPTVRKGVSASKYGNAYKDEAQSAKLQELEIGWFYNWSCSTPTLDNGIEYVPMIWGGANLSTCKYLTQVYQNGKIQNLLTFNEPDLESQSNISVESAISQWPMMQDIGVRLGSPAVANPYGNWLKSFMAQIAANGYRVDFVTIHLYQAFNNLASVNGLKSLLDSLYNTYGLPIWLTEFGAIDTGVWSGNPLNPACNQEAAINYITACCQMLESLDYLERYAWFVDDFGGGTIPAEAPYTALFNKDKITPSGEAYAAIDSKVAPITEDLGSIKNAYTGGNVMEDDGTVKKVDMSSAETQYWYTDEGSNTINFDLCSELIKNAVDGKADTVDASDGDLTTNESFVIMNLPSTKVQTIILECEEGQVFENFFLQVFTDMATDWVTVGCNYTVEDDRVVIVLNKPASFVRHIRLGAKADLGHGVSVREVSVYTGELSDMLGDVNADGKINASDATRILLASVGKITLTEEAQAAADVDANGSVNSVDASRILLHAVGKKPIA